jgi:hypothetical protein
MEKEDNAIVVFRTFDDAIQANIAKTKLDAYGIPCFLTEENMAGLYPGASFHAFKIRLHLFESDLDRAASVLQNELSAMTADDGPICPRCHSNDIRRDFPKKDADRMVYALFGIFLPHKKINVCQVCGTEF